MATGIALHAAVAAALARAAHGVSEARWPLSPRAARVFYGVADAWLPVRRGRGRGRCTGTAAPECGRATPSGTRALAPRVVTAPAAALAARTLVDERRARAAWLRTTRAQPRAAVGDRSRRCGRSRWQRTPPPRPARARLNPCRARSTRSPRGSPSMNSRSRVTTRASSWRTRSRVMPNSSPTSWSVFGSFGEMRSSMMRRSRSSSVAANSWTFSRKTRRSSRSATFFSTDGTSPVRKSPWVALPSSSRTGASIEEVAVTEALLHVDHVVLVTSRRSRSAGAPARCRAAPTRASPCSAGRRAALGARVPSRTMRMLSSRYLRT